MSHIDAIIAAKYETARRRAVATAAARKVLKAWEAQHTDTGRDQVAQGLPMCIEPRALAYVVARVCAALDQGERAEFIQALGRGL